jgi:hypothetical protein
MAQPLTYRQLAGIHGDRANIFESLAKAKRNEARAIVIDSNTTESVKLTAIALFDKAVHYHQLGVSATQQQADANAQADAAGEPA